MPSKKIDAIVEAVRYDPSGQIQFVRIYERISTTFADRSLLMRPQLVERLKKGQRFVAGVRQHLMGATFTTGPELRLVGEAVQTTSASGDGDQLTGIPRL